MVARVLSPHGVEGDLKCRLVTEFPERFEIGLRVYFGGSDEAHTVRTARLQGDFVYLLVSGIGDRGAAEAVQGAEVEVSVADAVPLAEGQYYWYQVIGLRVEDESGQVLGEVSDILETGANDVYVVHGPNGEFLIPAISEVVREISPDLGRIVIHPLPGLLPDARPPRARRKRPS